MNLYIVEFFGTLFITLVMFVTRNFLASGVALMIALYLGGKLSVTAAFNPAIAFALYSNKEIVQNKFIFMVAAEILGALVAFFAYNKYLNKG